MVTETFDGVFCGCVANTNGKNSIDDAKRKVVVSVLFRMGKGGEIKFGLAAVYEYSDFGLGEHKFLPNLNGGGF